MWQISSYNFLLLHDINFLENVLHLPLVFPVPSLLPSFFSHFGKSFDLFCDIEFCLSPNFTIGSGISKEFVLFIFLVFGYFPWREGKCWLDAAIFKLEVIQHVLQLFVLKSLKLKIYKTITIEYLYDFYLDPPVFNLLPHLLSLHFFC